MRTLSRQHPQNKLFNWQKGSIIILILCTCFGIVSSFVFLRTIFLIRDIPSQVKPPETKKTISLEEKARSITVKIVVGEFWGSGILIARKDNIYRVLTNDHVLSEEIISYPIHTPDGKIFQGRVVASASDFDGNDLAILEFQGEKVDYQLADFGEIPQRGDKVFTSGFPFPQLGEENQGWVFHQGVVWGMLEKPLQEGYQLGYTNHIQKGMSGGALLNSKGEVVAVNGMHAYPLLGKPYLYQDGTIPDDALIEEMVRHSWGIPINRIPVSLLKVN